MGLQFAHIEYSIQTKSLDIFNIGCDGNCKGCFNNNLKDWNQSGFSIPQVVAKVVQLDTKYGNLIEKILLVGGDPVDAYLKYKEYLDFVKQIKSVGKPIFLFTRYDLDTIPEELLKEVDYVKTGAYIPELTCNDNYFYGIKLATSNQRIYNVKEVLQNA